eukprot:COSAG02_NODE_38092_length_433_cov_1.218563_2_plen_62_part_01
MTAVCYPSCFHGTSFLTERARGSDRAAMDEPVAAVFLGLAKHDLHDFGSLFSRTEQLPLRRW